MMLLILFGFVIFLNACFYLLFSKFTFSEPQKFSKDSFYPVSVIVCAKNEAENLKENIPFLLDQEYPDFELIIIDDASSDNTPEVIEHFMEQDSRVKTVQVRNNEAFWSNKKYSLTLGIKKAKNIRLVFTDADCRPNSKYWLQQMVAPFSDSKQIVLGYGAYEKRKGLLNGLIRFETIMTAIQYFSYAKMGIPYMGVGRNLAYTSHLFYQNRGFMSHMNLRSGDDDLFVNETATASNAALSYSEDAFTISKAKTKWKDWRLQKRRHITTAKHYKPIHRLMLALFYFGNLLFWILSLMIFFIVDWKIPLALIIMRWLLMYLFIGKGAKLLKEKDLIIWLPFLELFLVFFQLTIFISNSISKPKRWK